MVSLTTLSIMVGVSLELSIPQILADFINEASVTCHSVSWFVSLPSFAAGCAPIMSIASRYVGTAIGWSVANDLRINATDTSHR